MRHPAYAVARAVAPRIAEHLHRHRATVEADAGVPTPAAPDAHVIERMVEAAFWASVRREEGYVPKMSLAFVPAHDTRNPMLFAQPLPLDPGALTRLAAAVERPGIHLGVWTDGDELSVWGTSHSLPPMCFVVEVVAPGLLVLKHRPRHESRKFVNVAVLEGDRIKIVDEARALAGDCPTVLASMIGADLSTAADDRPNVLVQLALSMRRHGHGGILLVVPSERGAWRESIVHPIRYAVRPAFAELADLARRWQAGVSGRDWTDAFGRAIDGLGGLTAVDGAAIITRDYELLAFGAKIRRRDHGAQIEDVVVSEPIEGTRPARMHPGQLGGTRHLSAAQFVHDQPDALALVASQDGQFTMFAWSQHDRAVHAHRVEVLLL